VLRQTHAEQLAQAQRSADDRVHALTEALAVASASAEALRGQLAAPTLRAAAKRSTPRKTAPRTSEEAEGAGE
jgi:predicted lipoprotein